MYGYRCCIQAIVSKVVRLRKETNRVDDVTSVLFYLVMMRSFLGELADKKTEMDAADWTALPKKEKLPLDLVG